MAHTILLLQANAKPECRTYTDYESVNECMEGVCKIYEEHLKSTNPNLPSITYDISQLFEFIDQVHFGMFHFCQNLNTDNLFPAGRSLLLGLPEVHQRLRSVQQGMDQREDLHPPQAAGGQGFIIFRSDDYSYVLSVCFVLMIYIKELFKFPFVTLKTVNEK